MVSNFNLFLALWVLFLCFFLRDPIWLDVFLYPFADIIEDLYSPRTAAMDFVSELVRKRGKENLQKFIIYIVEIFNR